MIDHDELDIERISDESDRASKIELENTQECVDKVLASIERPPSDFDGIHCIECDQEIPQARLATGAFRDIYCQELIELRRKQTRRDR